MCFASCLGRYKPYPLKFQGFGFREVVADLSRRFRQQTKHRDRLMPFTISLKNLPKMKQRSANFHNRSVANSYPAQRRSPSTSDVIVKTKPANVRSQSSTVSRQFPSTVRCPERSVSALKSLLILTGELGYPRHSLAVAFALPINFRVKVQVISSDVRI
jgi:hypothetical protein